jgi:hypothetical protein
MEVLAYILFAAIWVVRVGLLVLVLWLSVHLIRMLLSTHVSAHR